MKVQTAKKMMQIQAWAAQINECRQSGLTVRQWCRDNGIGLKSFYYRQRRVREELLDALEPNHSVQLPGTDLGYCLPAEHTVSGRSEKDHYLIQKKPVFAALPIPAPTGAAVTVRMGEYAVEIENGADDVMVERVLRTVARL